MLRLTRRPVPESRWVHWWSAIAAALLEKTFGVDPVRCPHRNDAMSLRAVVLAV